MSVWLNSGQQWGGTVIGTGSFVYRESVYFALNNAHLQHLDPETFRKSLDPVAEMKTAKEQLERLIRAESLLEETLGSELYRRYVTDGFITIASRKTKGRRYVMSEIEQIKVYDGTKLIGHLCIVIRLDVPKADLLVMKKLFVEADEKALWKVAKFWPANEWECREAEEANLPESRWRRFWRERLTPNREGNQPPAPDI